jgi:GH35 family endo-1,4-beta-xylanase
MPNRLLSQYVQSSRVILRGFYTASLALLLIPPMPYAAQAKDTGLLMADAAANIHEYRQADAIITFKTAGGDPLAGVEVKIEQQSQDFLFGNIIFPLVGVLPKYRDIDVYRPDLFKRRFADLFNMAIFPFYWFSYEDVPGQPQWQRIMPALEWCELNNITPKGHPLAWVESGGTPRWLYDMPVELTESLLEGRITGAVKGFAGRIDIWDVVNEPSHTVTWETVMENPYGTRYTAIPISEIADWVEKCYRWAHQASPEATLVLNDYEQIVTHFIPDTRERFYKLAEELLKRDTPLHGLGLQAHAHEVWYDPNELMETLDYYAQLGLPLHITEFIPQSSGNKIKGGWKKGTWTEEAQAEFAAQVYRLCFGHPSVASINWWGLSDRYIWDERPNGGLIDENYRPKLVYNRLKQLIKEEWMTRIEETTSKDGSISFRGFHGEYKIILTTGDGEINTYRIHIKADEANQWEFRP